MVNLVRTIVNFHYCRLKQFAGNFQPAQIVIHMELFSDFARREWWKPKAGILGLILALVAGGGCGKPHGTPPPAAAPSQSDSTSPAATPAATPPPDRLQPSVPAVSANTGPTQLQVLNRAMLGWEMKNHRHPRSFEEFAGSANIQIPVPPSGQKYAFNQQGFIVLVNSTQ